MQEYHAIRFTESQSLAISSVRSIATLMIIICHIFQGYYHFLAWWFNIGVQIFLFMSGFLLAHSDYSNKYHFLKKRLQRILVPYWLLLLLALPIYYFFGNGLNIKINEIPFYLTGTRGIYIGVRGIEHLWFLAVIVICYIFAVHISELREASRKIKAGPFYLYLSLSFLGLQWLENVRLLTPSYAPWVATFILGYFISYRYQGKIPRKLFYALSLLALSTSGLRIYYENYAYVNRLPNNYVPWSKFLLGSFLFVALYLLFQKLDWSKRPKLAKALRLLDSYSYETYLTHQIFILGPFSFLYYTWSKPLNLLIISLLIITSTLLLKFLSNLVYSKLLNKNKSNVKRRETLSQ